MVFGKKYYIYEVFGFMPKEINVFFGKLILNIC